jgi:hypothetical protein
MRPGHDGGRPPNPPGPAGCFASLALRVAVSFGLLTAVTGAPALADDAACIAASEQALVLRKQGKLHGALGQLAACAAAGCPDEVKAECAQRIEAIKGEMPTLILAAKDAAGNDLVTAKVTLDGVPLPGALDGQAIALDPGEHTFTFTLAGQPPLEKKLVLRQGERDRHEIVVLGSAVIAAPPPRSVGAPPPLVGPPPSSWSTGKTLALVSGGLGLVGVGLGVAFGAYASSSQSREKSDCSASLCLSYPQAVEDYDVAKKDATASTVALTAGGVLVAAGVVLWLTAPRTRATKGDTPAAPMGDTPKPPAASPASVRLAPARVGTGRGLVLGVDL